MRKELEHIVQNRLFPLQGKPIHDPEKTVQYQLEEAKFQDGKLLLRVFVVGSAGNVNYFDTSIDATDMPQLMNRLLVLYLKSENGKIFHAVHKELDTISRNIY
ncbi:TPA: hypothetical protein QDB06_000843 [Burkholderia vietnamiensis]|nr:hypothetical protein [Burkholderia vietnamiensis]